MSETAERRGHPSLLVLQIAFFLFGLIALGYSGYSYLENYFVQSYENWAFEQELAGAEPSVAGYLGSFVGVEQKPVRRPEDAKPRAIESRPWSGRIAIPRLKLSAMVLHGVDNRTLRRAVGHIPGTAAPGQPGNVGLAAHRDTFFRALRNVRRNDLIRIESLDGVYQYQVDSIQIVAPDRVDVLEASSEPTLTLVTCYPFDFVGRAPERFIVRARQITPSPVHHRGS